ncbi:hypothetical protein COOONC_01176 [Cooperia oncophora]
MKRIATRLKKDSMVTMPNWPDEKCSEPPQRLQGMVSVKRRKRRVINISRKFQAELTNGILKFFPKKRMGIAIEPEFQIDLAKATVMYDEKRIVLILKVANEAHSLIPLEDSLERWREAILKHRLYRQEAVKKGLQPDTTHTLETISGSGPRDDQGWESHSCNKMFDEVHQMQGLTLEVLEKLTKTYEEMRKTNLELQIALKNIRDALMRPVEATTCWTSAPSSVTPTNISTFPHSKLSTTIPTSVLEGTNSSMDSRVPEDSGSDEDDDEYGKKKENNQRNKKKS